MRIVLLAQCITESCIGVRDNRRYLSAAGRKKVLNLAAYLDALGHEVTIVSNSYAKTSWPASSETLGEHISVVHSPTWAVGRLTPFRRGIATLFALHWLARHRAEVDLAIIYNYHLEFALPALWARRRHGLPFVLGYEDGLYLVRHYRSALYRWIERAVYRACSAVIYVNPQLRERLQACGVDKPGAVIHGYFNDADVSALTPQPGSSRELLFAGNFSRGFGFDELLRYIEHCPDGWRLNVCGRGGPGETEAVRSHCAVHPRANYLGFVSDEKLAELRQRAAAVILLNDVDSEFNRTNFPSKLFDYLSAGKLIVCTRNPLLADYAALDNMLLLESIADDLPRLGERLPQHRFDADQVAALHQQILDTLRGVIDGVAPSRTER
ncbi:glycosyltransferase [Piscinibacter sakaiensis]|uniref:glycosyltransferase n=1 Tax=Piscinibacter sakaiensis TaxID=1547922 RepID=UPI003AAD3801